MEHLRTLSRMKQGMDWHWLCLDKSDSATKNNALSNSEISVSRGDKTQLKLFITGVRRWEAYPRRRLDDGKLVEHVA